MRYTASSWLQDATAVAWTCLCGVLVYQQSLSRLDAAHVHLLWTFFQPVGPILLMAFLYARAVADWERQHTPYTECWPAAERRYLPPARDLFSISRLLAGWCATCVAACAVLLPSARAGTPPHPTAAAAAGAAAALALPPLMYAGAALVLLMPLNVLRRSSRRFFCATLWRVLIPLQPVAWSDFLVADMATSLAKSSSDLARSTCLMLHGQLAHPSRPESSSAVAACGPLTALSLAALVLPYFLRLLQCLSVWWRGGASANLGNALKYASSLPALMLTQMEHEHHVHRQPFPLRRLWLAVMVCNSSYSFWWDVEQDWGMPWLRQRPGSSRPRPGWWLLPLPAVKPDQLYSRRWYAWLVASNLLLRFSWAHRLCGDLEGHASVLLVVALLEVVRRWQWLYVRVEVELRAQGGLQLLPTDSEDDAGHSGGGERSASVDGAPALHRHAKPSMLR